MRIFRANRYNFAVPGLLLKRSGLGRKNSKEERKGDNGVSCETPGHTSAACVARLPMMQGDGLRETIPQFAQFAIDTGTAGTALRSSSMHFAFSIV